MGLRASTPQPKRRARGDSSGAPSLSRLGPPRLDHLDGGPEDAVTPAAAGVGCETRPDVPREVAAVLDLPRRDAALEAGDLRGGGHRARPGRQVRLRRTWRDVPNPVSPFHLSKAIYDVEGPVLAPELLELRRRIVSSGDEERGCAFFGGLGEAEPGMVGSGGDIVRHGSRTYPLRGGRTTTRAIPLRLKASNVV